MLIAIRSMSSSLTAAVTAKRHQSCHEGRAHVTPPPWAMFWIFNSPSTRPQGSMDARGEGARRQTEIWCGSVAFSARVAEISLKNHQNAKIPHWLLYSNENFISPFFCPPEAANPQKGRRHIRNRVHPRAIFGLNRPAGCRQIVDKKHRPTVKLIPRPSL